MSMKNVAWYYEKYMVKSIIPYITFVIIGAFCFIFPSLDTKISVIETFSGTVGDGYLIINEVVDYPIGKVYAYNNRSEMVVPYDVTDTEIVDNSYTVLSISKKNEKKVVSGAIKIDVEKDKTSLLNLVLGIENRYVEKDVR